MFSSNTPVFNPASFSRTPVERSTNTLGNKMALITFASLTGCDVSQEGFAIKLFPDTGSALYVFATWTEMDAYARSLAQKVTVPVTDTAAHKVVLGYLKAYEFMQTDADAQLLPFIVMGKPQYLPRVVGKLTHETLLKI